MINYAYRTDKGNLRKNNEDSYFFYNDDDLGLFIIADGMGGHKGGEEASKIAVDSVSETILKKIQKQIERIESVNENKVFDIIELSIMIANSKITSKGNTDQRYYGMGTTVVICLIIRDIVYVANIGDSKAYLLTKNENYIIKIENKIKVFDLNLLQISEEHSMAAKMLKEGIITKENEFKHYRTILTKCLGGGLINHVLPYKNCIKWNIGDYLLLCSDGLTDMLDEYDIGNIFLKNESNSKVNSNKDNQSLDKICSELVLKANENGGEDNITTILIHNVN